MPNPMPAINDDDDDGGHGTLPPAAVAALVEALKDPDADVRQHALWALTRVRGNVPLESLMTLAKDANDDVRQQALRLLARSRDPKAMPILMAATDPRRAASAQRNRGSA